jgi:2-iminobutanoate/2-iminopropanoate deaminase
MNQNKKAITTKNAPKALGPYSQAILAAHFCFVSGQLPIDPETGALVHGNIQEMTSQVMKNIQAILNEAGMDLDAIVRCDIFLTDLEHFKEVNEVYGSFFKGSVPPARQTVQVVKLPLNAPIEISCIAYQK